MYSKSISDTTPSIYYAYFISKDNIDKIKEIKDNKAKKDEILKNIPDNIIEKNNKLSFTKLNDIVNISYNGSILNLNDNNISNYNNDNISLNVSNQNIYNFNNMIGLNRTQNEDVDYKIKQKLFIDKENDYIYLYNDFETYKLKYDDDTYINYFYNFDNYNYSKFLYFNETAFIITDPEKETPHFEDTFLTYLMKKRNFYFDSGSQQIISYYTTCFDLSGERYNITNNYIEFDEKTNELNEFNEQNINELIKDTYKLLLTEDIYNEHENIYHYQLNYPPYNTIDIIKKQINQNTLPTFEETGYYFCYFEKQEQETEIYYNLIYYDVDNQTIKIINPIYFIAYDKKLENMEQPIISYNFYISNIKTNKETLDIPEMYVFTYKCKTKKKLFDENNNFNDLSNYIYRHIMCELNYKSFDNPLYDFDNFIYDKNTNNDIYNIIDNNNTNTNNITSNNLYFNDKIVLDKFLNLITFSSLNPYNSNQYLRLIKSFINDKPQLNDITSNNYYLTIPERFRPNYVFKTLIPIECYYINSSLIHNTSSSSSNKLHYDLIYKDNKTAILTLYNDNIKSIDNYGKINLNNIKIKKTYAPLIIMPNGFVYIDTSSINLIINEQLELNKIHSTEDNNIEYENLYVLRKINICAFSFNYDNTLNINKKDFDYYNNFENNNPIIDIQLSANNHPLGPGSSSSSPGYH